MIQSRNRPQSFRQHRLAPILTNKHMKLYLESEIEAAIAAAAIAYLSTGEIPELLLMGFDQNGKWMEESTPPGIIVPEALERLQNTILTESQCSTVNSEGERILLTSYITPPESGDIPWHEIRGRIYIDTRTEVVAPHLRKIKSEAAICASSVWLPELKTALDLVITADELLIPKLETVRWAEIKTPNLTAPSLKTLGYLEPILSTAANLPALETVYYGICGYSLREFHAPLLQTVNPESDDWARQYGLILTFAKSIDAPNLKFVGARCVTCDAPDFFNLDLTVDGEWDMHPVAKRRYLAGHLRRALRDQSSLEI